MTSTVTELSLRPARTPGRTQWWRRPTRRAAFFIGLATILVLLLIWQLSSMMGWLPASVIPPADRVFTQFGALLVTPAFWAAVGRTVASAGIGLLIVIVIATPLSLLIGLSRFARDSSVVVLEFLKPVPPVALIPLTLLLWGPSPTMEIFLIVFGAIWPLLTQMTYGVRQVNGIALQVAKSYRLGRWLTLSRVIVPSLLPFTATGLRVSAAIALIIAIVTEMVAGAPGLGQEITLAQLAGQLPTMYALILAAGFLGLAVNAVLQLVERRVLFWHASQREGQA